MVRLCSPPWTRIRCDYGWPERFSPGILVLVHCKPMPIPISLLDPAHWTPSGPASCWCRWNAASVYRFSYPWEHVLRAVTSPPSLSHHSYRGCRSFVRDLPLFKHLAFDQVTSGSCSPPCITNLHPCVNISQSFLYQACINIVLVPTSSTTPLTPHPLSLPSYCTAYTPPPTHSLDQSTTPQQPSLCQLVTEPVPISTVVIFRREVRALCRTIHSRNI